MRKIPMQNVVGIGTDIVELEKISRYSNKKSFLNKVFTKNEIEYAKSKKNKIPHLATAFAAKEAVFKALGTGWINPKDIEIIRNKKGKPKAVISGDLKKYLKNKNVMLTLSYSNHYAVAFAVIKKEDK